MSKFRYYVLFATISLSFLIGLLESNGIVVETQSRLIIDFLIIFLFILLLQNKNKFFLVNYYIVILLLIILVSFFINNTNITLVILFIRRMIIPILVLIICLKLPYYDKYYRKYIGLLEFLFIIQIIFNFIKFSTIGIQEGIIGTMSISSGSLATVFPLMAITILYPKYFSENRKRFLLYVFMLTFIGIVSKKGAILFYIPLLYLSLHLIFFYLIKKKKFNFNYLVTALFITVFFGYIIIRLVPRFNPEYAVWGSFDLNFVINFVTDYETRYGSTSGVYYTGRLSVIPLIFDQMSNFDFFKVLFGIGPGEIIKTGLVSGQENVLHYDYQLGYGSRNGIWWLIFQIGLVGFVAYTLFHILIIKKIFNNIKHPSITSQQKMIFYSVVLMILIILIDTVTYSTTSIENYTAVILSYSFIGLSINKVSNQSS